MTTVGPFTRNPGGSFTLELGSDGREIIVSLAGQLRDLILAGDDDGVLVRLAPTAYHADPGADAEYRRYMSDELRASRLAAIDGVLGILGSSGPLSEAALHGLMTTLNSLRLVLGTLLDVGEDDPDEPSEDDPLADQRHLYSWLGWLLECLVGVLAPLRGGDD